MFLVYLALIASGVFLLVYGGMLFRITLAVGAFVLGFALCMWLFAEQTLLVRLLISIGVGGVLGLVGYFLLKMVLHIAGAIMGAVLALIILSILPVPVNNTLSLILILLGSGVSGFFGNRMGDWVIILATSLTGAYAILLGLTYLFPASMGVDASYVSARIPFTAPAFVVFLILLAIGALSQFVLRGVRGRFVNF